MGSLSARAIPRCHPERSEGSLNRRLDSLDSTRYERSLSSFGMTMRAERWYFPKREGTPYERFHL
jgi:hypothetical protein